MEQVRRRRGRPPGSKNKPKTTVPISVDVKAKEKPTRVKLTEKSAETEELVSVKNVVVNKPVQETVTLTALHVWKGNVVVSKDGDESSRYTMPLEDFALAIIDHGYNKQFGITLKVLANGNLIFYRPSR